MSIRNCLIGQFRKVAYNVGRIGEEADLKAKTFSLAPTPKGIANVQFSTKLKSKR